MPQVLLDIEQSRQCLRRFGLDVSPNTLRLWCRQGRLDGHYQDRDGHQKLYFQRGQLVDLVKPTCPICGERFTKTNQRQRFCSQRCRQKNARL